MPRRGVNPRELAAHRRDQADGASGRDERIAELEREIATAKADGQRVTERWQKEKVAADKVLGLRKELAGDGDQGGKRDSAALRKNLDGALAALRELQGKDPLVHVEVTPEVVARVISDWTGIPVGKMVSDEAATLLEFEKNLRGRKALYRISAD